MANVALRKDGNLNTPSGRPSVPAARGRWAPTQWMEDLLGWDPFREMSLLSMPSGLAFSPDFEIEETKDNYVFKADLPGVSESDVDISLSGNQLTISGKREQQQREETTNYFCCERSYGAFSRSFTLPQGAKMEDIKADLKDGVLTVLVPKKPEVLPRRISLGSGVPKTSKGSA